MLQFAQVRAVKAHRALDLVVAVQVLVSAVVRLVALLALDVLYEIESNRVPAVVRGRAFFGGVRLRASHVQRSIAVVVGHFRVLVDAAALHPVALLGLHLLLVLRQEFPFREIFLVLLVVEHFAARVDLLHAKLVVVIREVDIVVVIVGGRIRVVLIDQRRLGLNVVPNVLSIFVDDVVGMLEVCRRWLALHLIHLLALQLRLGLLLLLLLEMKSVLLLLLTVGGRITALLAFSFTLSFLAGVGRALWTRNLET